MTDPTERFLSPGAAFAAQQAEETRLQLAVERALGSLADQARSGMASYSLSQTALRDQWEKDVTRAVNSLGLTGEAGDQLKTSLMEFDAGGELYEVADSVMKFGLSVGASQPQVSEAFDILIEEPSLTAAGGLKDLWNKIVDWVQPRRRHIRTKAARMVRTGYTGYSGHLAQLWLKENGYPAKTWVTRHDDKVRTTHRAADGQTVPIDSPFQVGAVELMWPGQHGGPMDEIANCRCVIIAGNRQ